jgi:hypothetical protein
MIPGPVMLIGSYRSSCSPEQESAENLAALMATTLAGKVWEGWDRLCDSQGVPVNILDSLPMSPATKKLNAEFEQTTFGAGRVFGWCPDAFGR